MASSDNGSRGIGTLVRDLASESATLVRQEATLARTEIAAVGRGLATGTALVATGAVLALLGGLSLLTGIVLLVGDQWLPADLYWVGALLVLVVSVGVAAFFLKRGLSLVSPSALAPDQTVETLREDKEWLKRRMTSAGTSS